MSAVEAAAGKAQAMVRDSVKTVIAASMVGTAIEFYDFYAYGTAAANYSRRCSSETPPIRPSRCWPAC